MKYLFDTNIISELYKPRPNPQVIAWVNAVDVSQMHVSAISIGEMRHGVEKKCATQGSDAVKRLALSLKQMETAYAERIWDFDRKAAHLWGRIMALIPNHPIDAQIAAIALAHDAVLVTRDGDFADLALSIAPLGLGLRLLNPFEA